VTFDTASFLFGKNYKRNLEKSKKNSIFAPQLLHNHITQIFTEL